MIAYNLRSDNSRLRTAAHQWDQRKAVSFTGDRVMKINGADVRIVMTVLALGVSLLTIPTAQAQRAAGISRVGWLKSVVQVLGAPISIFSVLAWRN